MRNPVWTKNAVVVGRRRLIIPVLLLRFMSRMDKVMMMIIGWCCCWLAWTDSDWCWILDENNLTIGTGSDGLPACLPGWFSVLGRLARAWNFKWGANNVAVSLCYLSLSCLVDAKWRKVFLKHHRPQKFSSGHLCANTDVLLCTTCAIFGHDH